MLAETVMREIQSKLTMPEMGGILGAYEDRIVTEFHHDSTGITSARNYIPDTDSLNEVLRDWHCQGIKFVGFVHSHHINKKNLSTLDINYAKKIKKYCKLDEVLMVIYLPSDKTFHQHVL